MPPFHTCKEILHIILFSLEETHWYETHWYSLSSSQDYQRLQSSNTSYRYQISQLQKEKSELEDVLSVHMRMCNLKVPTHVLPSISSKPSDSSYQSSSHSILPDIPVTSHGDPAASPAITMACIHQMSLSTQPSTSSGIREPHEGMEGPLQAFLKLDSAASSSNSD